MSRSLLPLKGPRRQRAGGFVVKVENRVKTTAGIADRGRYAAGNNGNCERQIRRIRAVAPAFSPVFAVHPRELELGCQKDRWTMAARPSPVL